VQVFGIFAIGLCSTLKKRRFHFVVTFAKRDVMFSSALFSLSVCLFAC